MDIRRFIELIEDPSLASNEEDKELTQILAEHPYSVSLKVLDAKIAHLKKNPDAGKKLNRAAIATVDRPHLKNYMNAREWPVNKDTTHFGAAPAEKTEKPSGRHVDGGKTEEKLTEKGPEVSETEEKKPDELPDVKKTGRKKPEKIEDKPDKKDIPEEKVAKTETSQVIPDAEKKLGKPGQVTEKERDEGMENTSSDLIKNIGEYKHLREKFENLLYGDKREPAKRKMKSGSEEEPFPETADKTKAEESKEPPKKKPSELSEQEPEEERKTAGTPKETKKEQEPATAKDKTSVKEKEKTEKKKKKKKTTAKEQKVTGKKKDATGKKAKVSNKKEETEKKAKTEKETIDAEIEKVEDLRRKSEKKEKDDLEKTPKKPDIQDKKTEEDLIYREPDTGTIQKITEKKKAEGFPVNEEEDPKVIKKFLKQLGTEEEPEEDKEVSKKLKKEEQEEIIENFIKSDQKIKNVKSVTEKERQREDLSLSSIKFRDDIISENLAQIMISQGKLEKAIDIYKKLIWKYPQKKAYFASQIEELKKKLGG